ARDLEPGAVRLRCEVLACQPSLEAFAAREHILHFAFPAFRSFDPRTPLPVEYCIEAWQRPDLLGASSPEQLLALSRCQERRAVIPGAGPEWEDASPVFVTTVRSDKVHGKMVECEVDMRKTALVSRSQVYFSVKARYLSLPLEASFSPRLCWSAPVALPELVPSLPSPAPLMVDHFAPPSAAISTLAGMGSMVLHWPFRHPASFCGHEDGHWVKGPFVPNTPPGEFPLPFRVQCRTLAGNGDSEPPRWSEWREVEAYEFVRRQIANRQPSQRLGSRRWARQGQFCAGREGELGAEEDCLDPAQDPLGVLTSDWALLVSGLDVGEEDTAWSGLTQLRWVSCSVEGTV
ncbi:unnamed protein product, partial [Effrenium voratum]